MTGQHGYEATPLTVLGGYLGSGKTTALREHLLSPSSEPTGIVVNDFGEIEVDALVLDGAGGDLVSFSNGCVCCTPTDGVGDALDRLRGRGNRRVVIEASGVAALEPLAAWATTPGYSDGGVVVCANALDVAAKLTDRWIADTCARQLAAADVVLLTHADVATPTVLEKALDVVGRAAPRATVLVKGPQVGLGVAIRVAARRRDAARAEADGHLHAQHVTWTLAADAPLDEELLTSLLSVVPAEIARIKGIVHLTGEPVRPRLLQATGPRWALTEVPADPAGRMAPGARSALVVIARERTDRLAAWFEAAGLTPTTS